MKYSEISITERRHRDRVRPPRQTTTEHLLDRYSDRNQNLYMSYTVMDKLGINPRSGYRTPVGIYSYPAQHVLNRIQSTGSVTGVEYMGTAPYINVFKPVPGARPLDLSTYSVSDLGSDVGRLTRYFVGQGLTSAEVMSDLINAGVEGARTSQNDAASNIWNITRTLAEALVAGTIRRTRIASESPESSADVLTEWKDRPVARPDAVLWNSILRKILKYDYATDATGLGIIHPAEPVQAVFFQMPAIQMVERVRNRDSDVNLRLTQIANIGSDFPAGSRRKILARQSHEYQKLIAQNLNNLPALSSRLRRHMHQVTNPGLQRALIKKNLSFLGSMDLSKIHPEAQDLARQQFIKRFSKVSVGPELDRLLSEATDYLRLDTFMKTIGISEVAKQFESAVLKHLDELGDRYLIMSSELLKFAEVYATEIRDSRWTEAEKYFQTNRIVWKRYQTKFDIPDQNIYFVNDIVLVKNNGTEHIGEVEYVEDQQIGVYMFHNRKTLEVDPESPEIQKVTSENREQFIKNLPYQAGDYVKFKSMSGHDLEGRVVRFDLPFVIIHDVSRKVDSRTFYTDVHSMEDTPKVPQKVPANNTVPGQPDKNQSTGNVIDKKKLKDLIDKGKNTGVVTYDELTQILPPDKVTSEQIEDVISMISELGIDIVES